MLIALNIIAAEQSHSTLDAAKKVVKLLNYVITHPEAITWYHTRGMNIRMHSDA